MLPILPKEFLWSDKKTMDEFFELDPINEDFYEVFVKLRENPFNIQADSVKVFNEVYYQITRMFYEHPLPGDLKNYIIDIKANLGWNYSTELVLSMAYFIISLIEKPVRPLNKFFTKEIRDKLFRSIYWKHFKSRFEKLKKDKRYVVYKIQPCPQPVVFFENNYIDWRRITNNYDMGCVDSVIRLWKNYHDRQKIAKLIEDAIDFRLVHWNSEREKENTKNYLRRYRFEDSDNREANGFYIGADSIMTQEEERLAEKLITVEREKVALQKHVNELEAENERLKSLLDTKKRRRVGIERRFTLGQIVDYCKDCVNWDDAKSIVAMLNKLIRRTATEEDEKLVDSIETEFKHRLGVGISVEHAQIGVNSPGNIIANKVKTNNE